MKCCGILPSIIAHICVITVLMAKSEMSRHGNCSMDLNVKGVIEALNNVVICRNKD